MGRPLGVTIIAIVLAVSGVFQILVGTEALGYTSLGLGDVAKATDLNGWAAIISGALSIIGGFGLFTLAGWAWMLAIVVLGIRVVADAITIVTFGLDSLGISAVTNIVISALILWYFFRPSVREAFGR